MSHGILSAAMRKSDVIQHFGSQAAIGRELGIGKAAVSKWPPLVPRPWAAELHIRTRGKLKFDPDEYCKAEDDKAIA